MIRTLVARGLITEAGHDAESGAVVFATTPYFLERMGLRLARRAAGASSTSARGG